ncbi:mitogen-activated protein kinase kinase kinase 7-interacting protein 1 [Apostichopus japonicus]|uniref:Mitogen-activated protein kinase kinase kinase 7-interacting protein 1 n=1 Tax=Stichopus japonicus TaxID=307972 RepID=A0A2G8L195_STIJA|nr:mitogen-activated protein kinase kinase kinase 7-interacting protein 1 [Apostichopus japonicus]
MASREPVIADPDIIGGLGVKDREGFLVMYTHGFWQALEAATGTNHVDKDIADMVEKEFSQQCTLSSVAQAVVDRVVRMHHGAYMNGGKQKQLKRREDITVIVRNFNFPLGQGFHIYIPPSDMNVRENYPVQTPIFDPSKDLSLGANSGSSTQSTPVPLEQTPRLRAAWTLTPPAKGRISHFRGLLAIKNKTLKPTLTSQISS